MIQRFRLAEIDLNHLMFFVVRFVQLTHVPRKFSGQILIEYLKNKKQVLLIYELFV